MYDPNEYFSSLLRNPLAGIVPAPKRDPLFAPLPPDQEESELAKIGKGLLGGIAAVGKFLDETFLGRSARGLLAGKPRELLAWIPGSDTVGLTDSQDYTTGRQLAENWGWIDKDAEGFLPAAVGIGVDLLTSPSTYFSGPARALTETGKQLQKLGGLAKTTRGRVAGYQAAAEIPEAAREAGVASGAFPLVSHGPRGIQPDFSSVLSKPQGGLLEFQFPFLPSTRHVFGAGPGGEAVLDTLKTAGQWTDKAVHTGGWLNPLGYAAWPVEMAYKGATALQPYVAPLFSPAYRNVFGNRANQEVAKESFARQQALQGQADKAVADLFYEMKHAGLLSDAPQTATWTAGGRAYQTTLPALGPKAATDLIADIREHPALYQTLASPLEQVAKDVGDRAVTLIDQFRQNAPTLGHRAPDLNEVNWATGDPLGYLARHTRKPAPRSFQEAWEDLGASAGPVHQMHPSVLSKREDWTRGLDRQTYNELIQHPQLALPIGQELPAPLRSLTELERLDLLRRRLPYASEDQLQGVVRALATKDPGRPAQFDRFLLDDLRDTLHGLIRQETGSEAVHQIMARNLKEVGTPGTERFLPLSQDLLEKAGFSKEHWENAAQQIFQRAGITPPADAADWLRYAVDPADFANATRVLRGFSAPSVLKPVLGVADWLTALFKGGVTSPWPGFHIRNVGSGQLADLQAGLFGSKEVGDMLGLIRGGTIPDAHTLPFFRGRSLTPEQATEELRKLYFADRVGQHGLTEATEATGDIGREFSRRFPGEVPFAGVKKEAAGWLTGLWREPGGWNPLGVRGVLGKEKSTFAPVAHGENLGEAAEAVNRGVPWLKALREGYAPEVAAGLSRRLHGDYLGGLSDFERNVMRRLVPFYSYTRTVSPHVVEALLQQPGGLYGASAQVANELRQNQKQFVPTYLGGGLAVPVGEEQDGTQRFLTKLDINPAEGIFDVLRPTLGGTLLSLLGQTNPLVKLPLELATGKQFFSGRNLEELHGPTGNVVLDQIIMNSPASRAYTTVRTLLDPRKYEGPYSLPVNLLTGARLSDVDMERQREYAARDWITEKLRGEPGVRVLERPYVPRDQLDKLSPQDVLLMRLQASLEKRAAERRKQEAAAQK